MSYNYPIHLDMEDWRLPEHKPGYGETAFVLAPRPKSDSLDEFFERLRRVPLEDE